MSTKTQQKAKPRLGRGLSSLISISDLPVEVQVPSPVIPEAPAPKHPRAQPAPAAEVDVLPTQGRPIDGTTIELSVEEIHPNPHQPRQTFSEASLNELAASIRSSGLIQPIVVRKVGSGYELVAGERRLRAARQAGLSLIPAIIRDVDPAMQAMMALVENIQREDLNPLERAQGYRTLIDQLGLTQAELAGRLGEERSSVANYIRLLDLAEPVKAMVRDGRLSLGHAKLIAGIPDILEQERLANLVLLQGLSVRNLERAIQEAPKAPAPPPKSVSPHLADLEKSIARQLGLRVQIRAAARKGKGRLIIHYASLDQFDELLARLGVKTENE